MSWFTFTFPGQMNVICLPIWPRNTAALVCACAARLTCCAWAAPAEITSTANVDTTTMAAGSTGVLSTTLGNMRGLRSESCAKAKAGMSGEDQ